MKGKPKKIKSRNIIGKNDNQLDVRIYSEKESDFSAVFTHGFLGSAKKRNRILRYASNAGDSGYYGVAFSFSGRGKSTGKKNFYCLEQQEQDIISVLDFVSNQGIENIVLGCSSLSCIAGLKIASEDKRIKAIALLSPQTTFESLVLSQEAKEHIYNLFKEFLIKEEEKYFPPESHHNHHEKIPISSYSGVRKDSTLEYSGMLEANALEYAEKLNIPAIVFLGIFDKTVKPESIRDLYKKISSKDKTIIEMEDYHNLELHRKEVEEKMFKFFERIKSQY